MPNLPACNLKNKYHLTFWTVEADPKEDAGVSKNKLARAFQLFGNLDKCFVSKEVSDTGYHHHHVVCRFNKPQRLPNLIKHIQKAMHFKKTGDKKISARVFHPRNGSTEDFNDLMSYITDKKYKDSDPDPDGPLEVKLPPCRHCGLHVCEKAIRCHKLQCVKEPWPAFWLFCGRPEVSEWKKLNVPQDT